VQKCNTVCNKNEKTTRVWLKLTYTADTRLYRSSSCHFYWTEWTHTYNNKPSFC